MFGYNDCRGAEAKRKIVDNYFVNPIAHLPLSRWSEKEGCCGKLSKEYFVFSYTNIANRKEKGIFFLGETCSNELADIVNERKKKANSKEVLPPAFFDGNFVAKMQKTTSDLNTEILWICNTLFVAWDLDQKESLMTNIMLSICLAPHKSISERQLLLLNKVASKDHLVSTGKCESLTESLALRNIRDISLPTCELKNIKSFFDIKNEKMYF